MSLFRKTPQQNTAYYELLDEIERVKTQMDNAYYNFQNAMDPDLIEQCCMEPVPLFTQTSQRSDHCGRT